MNKYITKEKHKKAQQQKNKLNFIFLLSLFVLFHSAKKNKRTKKKQHLYFRKTIKKSINK